MLRKILGIALGLSLALSSQIALSQVQKAATDLVQRGTKVFTSTNIQTVRGLLGQNIVPQSKEAWTLLDYVEGGALLTGKALKDFTDKLNNGTLTANDLLVAQISSELDKISKIIDGTEEVDVNNFEVYGQYRGWEDAVSAHSELADANAILTPEGKSRVVDVLNVAGNLNTGKKASIVALQNATEGTINFANMTNMFNEMTDAGLVFVIDTISASYETYGDVSRDITTANFLKYSKNPTREATSCMVSAAL